MAYTPDDFNVKEWSSPVEITPNDTIANLDDAVNNIIENDPNSVKNHINKTINTHLNNYLKNEFNKVYQESQDIRDEQIAIKNDTQTIKDNTQAIYNEFKGTYYGAFDTAPTEDPNGGSIEEGDLYYDLAEHKMKVYNGSSWINAFQANNTIYVDESFTGDGTTVSFSVSTEFDPSFVEVFLNGVLLDPSDYTLGDDKKSVTFNSVPADGDEIRIIAFNYFEVANTYTKSEVYTKSEIDEGNVVLEAIKKVDGAGSGLDADMVDGVQKDLLGIGGNGYSWVDETNNRAKDTTYTNTYGKPIMVIVSLHSPAGDYAKTAFNIDGWYISYFYHWEESSASNPSYHSIIVPSGSTYRLESMGSDSSQIDTWFELK